jgi:hypothetical protein
VRWDTPNRKRKNDMTEKCKMVDDQLEQVSGGAEEGIMQTQYIEFRDGL